jgi:DNA-directed RNA polymerase specialized sigma24 family protein
MKKKPNCHCAICKVERSLFLSLAEPPGSEQFSSLARSAPPLANFASISGLLDHLHGPRNGETIQPSAGEVLRALIEVRASTADPELTQSVLVLAFAPAIHRIYRELCMWFRELEPEDVAQQVFTSFLELAASAPVEVSSRHLPVALARRLRKGLFRWAEKEARFLLPLEMGVALDEMTRFEKTAIEDTFENVTILNDFLDHCRRVGLLSEFERDLLISVKVQGLLLKEVRSANPVLSVRAVESRMQRILKRLQKVAYQDSSKHGFPSADTGVGG